jgi:hypothetical protein
MRTASTTLANPDSRSGRAKRSRTLAGLLIFLCTVPVLLGNLACMDPLPVPIGNPENSKIDERLSGIWTSGVEFIVLDAFDNRSWLLSYYVIDFDEDEKSEAAETVLMEKYGKDGELDPDALSVPELLNFLEAVTVKATYMEQYKAWRTQIRGTDFLTWEPRFQLDEGINQEPEGWYVLKLTRHGNEQIELVEVNNDFNDLGDSKTRRQAERIIKRNVDKPELYRSTPSRYYRVAEKDYERVLPLIADAIICSSDDCQS